MRSINSAILFFLLLTAGCTVGPAYHKPEAGLPSAFYITNAFVNTNTMVTNWWEKFDDPDLKRLIAETLRSNYDLQIAQTHLRQSRFQRNMIAADLFPQVDANGSYIRSRGSKNVILPLGGSGGGGSSGGAGKSVQGRRDATEAPGGSQLSPNPVMSNPPNPIGQGGLPGATTDLYQTGFDANWEIDVFGGKRRQVEAANAEVEATIFERHALEVSLAAETALDYLQLRGSQERLRIAHENLTAQNDVLTLTKSKSQQGLASDLDSLQAASQSAATAATIAPLEVECRRWMHALALLSGREPEALIPELSEPRPIPRTPPEVPIGLPSQLLERRPDIVAAERRIAAANAHIGAAQADLFPQFALVGMTGLDSSSPGTLFNWQSRYFLISPTVAWRIFDAGRIVSNIKLQEANTEESVLQYRETILKALKEVEDALIAYAGEHARHEQLNQQYTTSRQALELARTRYDQGLADFLIVLDAERSALAAEDQLAQSDMSLSTDVIALYKSLGGGWQ